MRDRYAKESEQLRANMREAILSITGLLQELDRSNITGEINLHMADFGTGDEGAHIRCWLHVGGSIYDAPGVNMSAALRPDTDTDAQKEVDNGTSRHRLQD